MERDEAIYRLPATYAVVVELLDAGASDETIAERLNVDRAAVGPLTTVALAKLARLLAESPGPEPRPSAGLAGRAPGGGPAVEQRAP